MASWSTRARRYVRIGGTAPAARNVISGNNFAGIAFGCNSSGGGTGHMIQGNLIGTDATGAAAPPDNSPEGASESISATASPT